MGEGPIVHVQPIPGNNNHLKIEMKDEDFGDFVDETPQTLQMGSKRKIEIKTANDFGDYRQVSGAAKAPIA